MVLLRCSIRGHPRWGRVGLVYVGWFTNDSEYGTPGSATECPPKFSQPTGLLRATGSRCARHLAREAVATAHFTSKVNIIMGFECNRLRKIGYAMRGIHQ